MQASTPNSRIPGLDGLRAISIAFVCVGHADSLFSRTALNPFLVECLANHRLGVTLFFVISGFIITWVLRRERSTRGTISLSGFYVRRAFRILPPVAVYLVYLAWRQSLNDVYIPPAEWYGAIFFYWNYIPGAATWWVSHFWSLALEEQFYLLWPCCLILLGLWRSAGAAATVILLSPLIRIGTYFLFPDLRDRIGNMSHTQLDLIMFGCLAALLAENERGFPKWPRVFHSVALAAAIFAFLISPAMSDWARSYYGLSIRSTLEGLSLALIVVWVIQNHSSWVGRALEFGPLVYVGQFSFSLYLWQQYFLPPARVLGVYELVGPIMYAMISYHWIEQPFQRWGRHFSAALMSPLASRNALKSKRFFQPSRS